MDYGNTHSVKLDQIIPVGEDVFKACAYQAFECTVFETLPDNLAVTPRFAFNEMVMAVDVQAKFITKVNFATRSLINMLVIMLGCIAIPSDFLL